MEIIVGKTSGFCYGVKRAVSGALNQNGDNLYALGELVHNERVVNNLKAKGITVFENIEDVPDNSNLIIRAHGVSKEVYERAKLKNIKIIDYTCLNVLQIHKIIEEKNKNNYFVILTGDAKHPENIGSLSYSDNYFVIENEGQIPDAIKAYEESKLKNVLLISQTTYSTLKFEDIKSKLSKLIPHVEIFNTICKTTELRQKETLELSKQVDTMIVIGGKNSSNTKKLYDIAISNMSNVLLISDKDELDLSQVKGKVGIIAGASTPEESIKEVEDILKTKKS